MTTRSLPAPGLEGVNPLWTVDNSVYSAAAFEVELDRILRRSWVFVCHTSELPEVGSFMRREVAGDPIVVVRTGAATIRAFHSVCRTGGA